ncbi:D-alanyl-D-alanine carboxypeptidase family protein [Bradyrhizobium sp. CCBAU 051011]|uniref:D-alanyl-D-alanine carboxypeptidase family protein n=1 Tax=Bradyrhizobium sp. CCBAU 051011 TaxID=858422 RepID=UPI001FEE3840|nr:D-alanyl-D-alanine carboxypeptidase family protein [Bradyrhizobium sp. CCBAU 051011]
MDPWRLATKAQRRINLLSGVALLSWVLVWLASPGAAPIERVSASVRNAGASIESAEAASTAERKEPSRIASAEPVVTPPVVTPPVIALASAAIDAIEAPLPAATVIEKAPDITKAPDATAAPEEPKSFVVASLTDPTEVLASDAPAADVAAASTPASMRDTGLPAVSTIEINEECLVAEICIDRYLWALYERAPKIDAIKVHERRKVTIKRKGKTITVTRTFTKRVDEDFTWKDPKAADRAGMAMIDYVIGGMDKSFKLKLFHALHAAEQAGLSPGITSAFRDDYRQGIASGLKAATDRSYHGGSLRGGYGHGLAADIVSVKGATRAQRWVSTDKLWKWIDENGKTFGIGRPYLDRDPPHVGPIDGKEYASRRGGSKTQEAQASIKKRERLTARDNHRTAKRTKTANAKTAKLSKGRTM